MQCQSYLSYYRRTYIRPSKLYTWLEVACVSILISTLRFWIPYLFGYCHNDHHYHETQGKEGYGDVPNPTPFICPDHETNDLSLFFWNPTEHMVKWLLHATDYNDISTSILFAALFFFFFGTVFCFGIAVPTGLFIPAFIIGGIYGRLVGQLAAWMNGTHNLISSYAFLGSASALGGFTRVTISVALIALEATQNFQTSLYCYIVVVIAKLVGDSFNISIYDFVIEKKGYPFLVDTLGHEGYQLTTDEVMTKIMHKHELKKTQAKEMKHHDYPDWELPINVDKDNHRKWTRESDRHVVFYSILTVAEMFKILWDFPLSEEFVVEDRDHTNQWTTGGMCGTIERMIILRMLESR